jgi:hypothetical protein
MAEALNEEPGGATPYRPGEVMPTPTTGGPMPGLILLSCEQWREEFGVEEAPAALDLNRRLRSYSQGPYRHPPCDQLRLGADRAACL